MKCARFTITQLFAESTAGAVCIVVVGVGVSMLIPSSDYQSPTPSASLSLISNSCYFNP